MRYVIKKEFTGRNGWWESYRRVENVKFFFTFREALDELKVIKMQFTSPKSKAVIFGKDQDYTILRDTKYGHWITRYWLEKEKPIDHYRRAINRRLQRLMTTYLEDDMYYDD